MSNTTAELASDVFDRCRVAGSRLPTERYIGREFFDLEREKLWPFIWQVACRVEEIPKVGDYIVYDIVDQSILVTRTAPDTIKGYHNACRHRGSQLRQGCGSAREIRCRFHGWRWNLDGSLKDIPCASDFEPRSIEPEKLRLPEVQVGIWGGFVFVNMDLEAEPLDTFLDPLPSYLDKYDYGSLRFARYQTIVLNANWKTAMDAFIETYHLPSVHPQSLAFADLFGETMGEDPFHMKFEQFPGLHSRFLPTATAFAGGGAAGSEEYKPDFREGLLQMAKDQYEIQSFTKEAYEAIVELANSDAPLEVLMMRFAEVSQGDTARNQPEANGTAANGDRYDDEGGAPVYTFFPNLANPGPGLTHSKFVRFRPNGVDHESCLFDFWTLRRPSEGEERTKLNREFYADWQNSGVRFGRFLAQDLLHLPNVQKGMHSRALDSVLCGRQEGSIRHNHLGIDTFLSR